MSDLQGQAEERLEHAIAHRRRRAAADGVVDAEETAEIANLIEARAALTEARFAKRFGLALLAAVEQRGVEGGLAALDERNSAVHRVRASHRRFRLFGVTRVDGCAAD